MIRFDDYSMLDWATHVALSFIGKFYKWGGDDPSGFDCSGFCIEILKSVGLFDRNADTTAQRLYSKYKKVDAPERGCLAYWHAKDDTTKIVHVEFCLNHRLTIGSSGGGKSTTTLAQAIKQNAFIKVRPIRQKNLAGYNDPFYTKR